MAVDPRSLINKHLTPDSKQFRLFLSANVHGDLNDPEAEEPKIKVFWASGQPKYSSCALTDEYRVPENYGKPGQLVRVPRVVRIIVDRRVPHRSPTTTEDKHFDIDNETQSGLEMPQVSGFGPEETSSFFGTPTIETFPFIPITARTGVNWVLEEGRGAGYGESLTPGVAAFSTKERDELWRDVAEEISDRIKSTFPHHGIAVEFVPLDRNGLLEETLHSEEEAGHPVFFGGSPPVTVAASVPTTLLWPRTVTPMEAAPPTIGGDVLSIVIHGDLNHSPLGFPDNGHPVEQQIEETNFLDAFLDEHNLDTDEFAEQISRVQFARHDIRLFFEDDPPNTLTEYTAARVGSRIPDGVSQTFSGYQRRRTVPNFTGDAFPHEYFFQPIANFDDAEIYWAEFYSVPHVYPPGGIAGEIGRWFYQPRGPVIALNTWPHTKAGAITALEGFADEVQEELDKLEDKHNVSISYDGEVSGADAADRLWEVVREHFAYLTV